MKKLTWEMLIKLHSWSKQDYYVDLLTESMMKEGTDYMEIPDDEYEEAANVYNEQIEKENRLFRCTALNNEGMAMEKNGDIDGAIAAYEQNIKEGCTALHSFDRLAIIYRRRKEYSEEIRVVKKALEIYPQMGYFLNRLAKAEELLGKSGER